MLKAKCDRCGVEFKTTEKAMALRKAKGGRCYCSTKCGNKAWTEAQKKKNGPSSRDIAVKATCDHCGVCFDTTQRAMTYRATRGGRCYCSSHCGKRDRDRRRTRPHRRQEPEPKRATAIFDEIPPDTEDLAEWFSSLPLETMNQVWVGAVVSELKESYPAEFVAHIARALYTVRDRQAELQEASAQPSR